MTDLATRPLGPSGIQVPMVGLGCNNFGRIGSATETLEGTRAVLDRAIDVGATFLDTADIYGVPPGTSETLMGLALAGRRDKVILATKFGHSHYDIGITDAGPKGSPRYLRRAIEGSLSRLGTDYIDLYQLHTPDPTVPIEETLQGLRDLVAEGKIRAFGHSNFSAEQIRAADDAGTASDGPGFVTAQDEYSLLARGVESEILPAVRERGLGFLPYFPLHNGLLTGKFTRTERPADTRISRQRPEVADRAPWDALERYASFCRERGVSMLAATFGWLLATPTVTSVIAGATTPEQVALNVEAVSAWHPTPAELAEIDAIFARE